MATTISFFLCYSERKIKELNLSDKYCTLRCDIYYTHSASSFAVSKALGFTKERLTFTINQKVMPKWWDKGMCKRNHPDFKAINNELDNIKIRLNTLHQKWVENGFPEKNTMIANLLNETTAAQVQSSSLLKEYSGFVEKITNKKGSNYYGHKRTLAILSRFAEATKTSIDFNTLSRRFEEKFIAWVVETMPKSMQKQNTWNTANRYLQKLDFFLKYAHGEEITGHQYAIKTKYSEKRKDFPESVSEDELTLIINHIAKGKAELTKDWFVLSTQTALRWSDWDQKKFKIIDYENGKNIRMVHQKSKYALEIPLSKIAINILEKYNYNMPKKPTHQNSLKHLSRISKAIGMDRDIKPHDGRRSFCTLQEKAGVQRSIIMRISGHTTEAAYLRYVGISHEYNAEMLRRANPNQF